MKEFICIICPRGCHLKVDDNLNVTGNSCNRGIKYGKTEAVNPERTITSTVYIDSVSFKRLPIKTSNPIPKEKIFLIMDEINKFKCKAPVRVGDVLIKNVLGLNSDIVATRDILE